MTTATLHLRLVAGLLAATILTTRLHADEPTLPQGLEPEIPSSETILATLRAEHPRLLATAKDFSELRKLCLSVTEAQVWLAHLQSEAEKLLARPPVKYEIPDGKRLLAVSRAAKDRVLLLGLMHVLTGDNRYADRLWRELDTVTRFKDWNPSHFLDTAEMTFAVAIGYDWLYDTWTPEQRDQLRGAIVRLGLEQGLPIYRQQLWWSRAIHNWNQVCNGGLAVGALAIADDEPELAREILYRALGSLPKAMHEFSPDGGWGEGPGYWRYATEYNVYCLAALRTALGQDFGLAGMPGFSETGDFPIYFCGPTGQTFNYADAHSGWHGAPQLFWLATAFERPAWAAAQRTWATDRLSALDLLWGAQWLSNPSDQVPAYQIPLDHHFQGVSTVFLRSAWNDPTATFVGFKGGDNRVNHGQLDLGTFVLDSQGERWFTDLGPDNYNLPGYFGSGRWKFYRNRAEGHNTLVINPDAEPDQSPYAEASVVAFESEPDRALAVTDLSAAYARSATSVRRGIVLLDRRDVLVQDEITAEKPAEVWWFGHTMANVELDAARRVATLSQNGKTLYATLLAPPDASFQWIEAAPLPTSPDVPGQADESRGSRPVRKLAIHLANQTNCQIVVLLSPSTDAAVPLTPLSQW